MRRLAVALAVCGGCLDAAPAALDLAQSSDLTAPLDFSTTASDLAAPARAIVYVSGYSTQIARFTLDRATGALAAAGTTTVAGSSSFLAVHPDRRHLYALDESNARVRAFSIDGTDGALTPLGSPVSSGGSGPAHLAVDALGRFVMVANYGDGRVAIVRLVPDGSLGATTDTRVAGAQAHQIISDEDGTHVFVPCKGANLIAQYVLDAQAGTLISSTSAPASMAGAGSRHIALTAGFAYVIEENVSVMSAYARDAMGRLTLLQSLSTLPPGFTQANTGAEVAVFGRDLYGSNRGHESLVHYSLGNDGRMALVGHTATGGATPRSFAIDPSGRWLLVANQSSDEVRVFARDLSTGALAATNVRVTAPSPAFVGILD